MIILYPDCIDTIAAGSEDADYPAVNLLGDRPQKLWKAGSGETTETLDIVTDGAAVSGLYIGDTNATSGSVTVRNAAETIVRESHSLSGADGRFFVALDAEYTEILHIEISLTAPVTVQAGTVRCGTCVEYPAPQYGLKHKRDDHSIKEELSNGGLYVYKRNTPRTYALSFVMTKTQHKTIDALYDAYGSRPVAFSLLPLVDDADYWSGFFSIVESPDGTSVKTIYVNVSFELKEAV